MKDMPRVYVPNFLKSSASCMPQSSSDASRRQAFARLACFSENFFLNGAIWCGLEHIFINFSLKKIKKIIFYTKIMINCSHVYFLGDSGA